MVVFVKCVVLCACTDAVCDVVCVCVRERGYRNDRGQDIKILIVSEGLSFTMHSFIRKPRLL